MNTKIQKLSAIHNGGGHALFIYPVVYEYKDTKIVSNSQHRGNLFNHVKVVYEYKDTKIVSNSQRTQKISK